MNKRKIATGTIVPVLLLAGMLISTPLALGMEGEGPSGGGGTPRDKAIETESTVNTTPSQGKSLVKGIIDVLTLPSKLMEDAAEGMGKTVKNFEDTTKTTIDRMQDLTDGKTPPQSLSDQVLLYTGYCVNTIGYVDKQINKVLDYALEETEIPSIIRFCSGVMDGSVGVEHKDNVVSIKVNDKSYYIGYGTGDKIPSADELALHNDDAAEQPSPGSDGEESETDYSSLFEPNASPEKDLLGSDGEESETDYSSLFEPNASPEKDLLGSDGGESGTDLSSEFSQNTAPDRLVPGSVGGDLPTDHATEFVNNWMGTDNPDYGAAPGIGCTGDEGGWGAGSYIIP